MVDCTILVTGSSGFIGFHVCRKLLDDGFTVIGIDNLSDYYDVDLKKRRQDLLLRHDTFTVINDSIESEGCMMRLFEQHRPAYVIHLAAQAGVRYSIENPRTFLESNIMGTFEILEAARAFPPRHMLMASTSSAFGANTELPYRETDASDHQVSFYAATKKSSECMAHSYAHLFDLPITMFRFFTVYGPWGRPDMALFKFTKAIYENRPIDVYNQGDMKRDFTYIDDLVQGIRLLMDAIPERPADGVVPEGDSLSPVAPHRIVNIGNSDAVPLTDFIDAIETLTGRKAQRRLMPMQPGDVQATWADCRLLHALTGYRPETSVNEGVKAFIQWYHDYYQSVPGSRAS